MGDHGVVVEIRGIHIRFWCQSDRLQSRPVTDCADSETWTCQSARTSGTERTLVDGRTTADISGAWLCLVSEARRWGRCNGDKRDG